MLALFSALIAPYFIDWTSYRTAFEAEASRIVGQQVKVRGEADARLLPFPSVTFSDVTVGDDGEPAMTISRFSMDAELAPFLSGEVRIFDMRVEDPDVVVRILEDGSLDWALRRKPTTPGETVVLENVSVSNANITVIDEQNGRTHQIRNINALVKAGSLSGPWTIEGEGIVAGHRGGVSISTGLARDDGSIRMRMRVVPDQWPVFLEAEGEARIADSKPLYDGLFNFTAFPDDNGAGANPERPLIVAKGDFAATNERLSIEEWRAEIGLSDDPYIVTGKATIDTGPNPDFLLVADGQQINMDQLGADQAQGETQSAQSPSGDAGAPVSLAERFAVFNTLIDRLPPPPLPGRISLNLPAIVAGDTTLREIELQARPDNGAWLIDSFSANLPGRTVVEARGRLASGTEASFNGTLTVASNQPSGLANWLVGEVDPVIRRLGAAGFSANVSLSAVLQRFEALEVAIGPALLKGRLEQQLPANGRPSLSFELAGDTFDVEAARALAVLAGGGRDEGGLLTDYNVAARINAETLTLGAYSASGVETSLLWRDGELTLDRVTFEDLAGAAGSFSATLTDIDDAPNGVIEGKINAASADGLFRLAGQLTGGHAMVSRLGANSYAFDGLDAGFNVELNPTSGILIRVDGKAGGGDVAITASGAGLMPGGDGPRAITLRLDNPELYRVLEQAGFAVLPLEGEGPAQLSVDASAESGDGDLRIDASLASPGFTLSLDGNGAIPADGPATGLFDLGIEAQDIEPFAILFSLPLPQAGAGSDLSMTASLGLDGTTIVLSELEGTAQGNAFSGLLSFNHGSDPISGDGRVKLDHASLDWLAELALGPILGAEFGGSDGATWSSVPFLPPSSATPEMRIALEAGRIDLGRAGVATDFSAELTTGNGAIAFAGAQGRWFGGRLGGDMTLTNSGGAAFLLGRVRVAGADLADLDRAVHGKAALSGTFETTVSLEGTGSSMRDLVASLAGGGELAASDLAVQGIDPGAFPRILGAADREDFVIDSGTVSTMVAGFMTGGEISAETLKLPFTLTGGVMRFSNTEFTDGDATLSGDARVDLLALRLQSDWRLAFEPGVEAIAGGDPSVVLGVNGLLVDPALSIDAAQMSTYLSMRAFERERREVELLQAGVVEKQRLRREVALLKEREAQRLAAEEAARLAAEEAERRAAEEAARLAAEVEKMLAAEEARRAEEAAAAIEEAAEEAAAERARQDAGGTPLIERRALPAPSAGSTSDSLPDPPSALANEPAPSALPQLRFDNLPGVGDPIRSLIAPDG
ncbi:AsmA-like C-terminal region-containing protein [Hoeflea sp.]|uniref:AsmA family protein n=1 Tax=Hoeflea sp. TaxID=1940281 RepID=UPI0037491D0C